MNMNWKSKVRDLRTDTMLLLTLQMLEDRNLYICMQRQSGVGCGDVCCYVLSGGGIQGV